MSFLNKYLNKALYLVVIYRLISKGFLFAGDVSRHTNRNRPIIPNRVRNKFNMFTYSSRIESKK